MNKERRLRLCEIVERLNLIESELEAIAEEERDSFDNLPDGLQCSDRGLVMEAAADELDDIVGEIGDLSSQIENLINP